MRAHRLTPSGAAAGSVPALSNLIEDLGSAAFPASLFRMIYGWVRADHISAFIFNVDSKPKAVLAENAGPDRIASSMADQYCRDYWRYDLANRRPHDDWQGSWILQRKASEIAHANYRCHFYTAANLDDRVTLADKRGDRTLRINLYRPKGEGFTEDEVKCIGDSALLILALVRRHANYRTSACIGTSDHYRARLASVAPNLTAREAEVCAAIIRGLTSEGIALELGIGINTVLTYKKRTYARLNISSQNQLMKLVLDG